MVLEHERIAHEPCGCRTDKVTGLAVYLCRTHRDKLADDLYRADEESCDAANPTTQRREP